MNQNFTDIINGVSDGTKDLNVNDCEAVTSTLGTVTLGTGSIDLEKALVPLGSIIPWYDFNAAISLNTTYWAYCDGSASSITGVGAVTLPDLSNRYLVGFGTEAGGDIDSAAWATAAVGNASHQVNLEHQHTVGEYVQSTGDFFMLESDGTQRDVFAKSVNGTGAGAGNPVLFNYGSDFTMYTDNQSSTTQSIQPRSIRVRFIMRRK